jgi:hypothetical protein
MKYTILLVLVLVCTLSIVLCDKPKPAIGNTNANWVSEFRKGGDSPAGFGSSSYYGTLPLGTLERKRKEADNRKGEAEFDSHIPNDEPSLMDKIKHKMFSFRKVKARDENVDDILREKPEADFTEEDEYELDDDEEEEQEEQYNDDNEYMPSHLHVEVNVDIDDGQETKSEHEQYENNVQTNNRLSEQRKQSPVLQTESNEAELDDWRYHPLTIKAGNFINQMAGNPSTAVRMCVTACQIGSKLLGM